MRGISAAYPPSMLTAWRRHYALEKNRTADWLVGELKCLKRHASWDNAYLWNFYFARSDRQRFFVVRPGVYQATFNA